MRFTRITVDPAKMAGVPIIRDLRMPVATVVTMIANGRTVEQIIDDFPELESEDVSQAIHYAAAVLNERQFPLLTT